MAAQMLHITEAPVLETTHDLSCKKVVHLRHTFAACRPSHIGDFELLALMEFGSPKLARAIRAVARSVNRRAMLFNASTTHEQEFARADALHEARLRLEALKEVEPGAYARSRKFVEELVDNHLLVRQGDLLKPNIPVKHVTL